MCVLCGALPLRLEDLVCVCFVISALPLRLKDLVCVLCGALRLEDLGLCFVVRYR